MNEAGNNAIKSEPPGWVRTDMGGPQARLSIDDSIPPLLDTIDTAHGRGGLHYLDYLGRVVPW